MTGTKNVQISEENGLVSPFKSFGFVYALTKK